MCESVSAGVGGGESASAEYVDISYPLEPMQLIDLPKDYTNLINQPMKLCPTTNNVMRYPAMCLLCGEVICSGSYCCQIDDPENGQTKGACMQHAEKCSGSCGMFLRPLECKVMLISSSGKGCFLGAPYVDEYGEQDNGLKLVFQSSKHCAKWALQSFCWPFRRGNPLFLNEEMLSSLKTIWYSQSVSETVSRQIGKSSFRLLAFDWNEMWSVCYSCFGNLVKLQITNSK